MKEIHISSFTQDCHSIIACRILHDCFWNHFPLKIRFEISFFLFLLQILLNDRCDGLIKLQVIIFFVSFFLSDLDKDHAHRSNPASRDCIILDDKVFIDVCSMHKCHGVFCMPSCTANIFDK